MKVQVLVAAMNQHDHTLVEKMNIQSDVIVGNQCDFNSIEQFEYRGYSATYLNFSERGVGLNRNNALMRATGDICLFADDDMVYVENYTELIENAFLNHPDADIIAFNLVEDVPTRYIIKDTKRIRFYNFLTYGTARIAVKLSKIRENGILFNLCFGGGTTHCHGEDNIFISDCLKKGLKMYAVPISIAELTEERESTWNSGYNQKYFFDQGVLYKTISKKLWKLLCLQDSIRHARKEYKTSWMNAYTLMIKGGKELK
ncbi:MULTISPECIES: glycosyltransferase family 2 protein [Ruminococcus]|uniref:Glycosyltransferase n=1 Tax=Ruminococcus hominis TaxID=2763065 RepID=A0ABR7G5W5_9FIRM|nr:glycosyltransferase family 2 protein [Ruminococcus hominis]MBC5682823.1 glycosyltransferase [Ruminococcus hominis]RGH38589.1 glycosyltransferase [Firmicutes bacterium AM41-5BH]RHV04869.1 glycosyltransferase [Firmicutes bacterium OM07-11]